LQEVLRYSQLLGCESEPLGSGSGIAYNTRGDLGRYVISLAKGFDYKFLFAEFGTYSAIKVLGALREENQLFSSAESRRRQRAQAKLVECFSPASPSWRTSVVKKGLELIQSAQRMLSEGAC
jgi:Protein of unknown function (DUF2817)